MRLAVATLALVVLGKGNIAPALQGQRVHTVAEQFLFASANAERVNRGLPPLRWDEALYGAAAGHARWMASAGSIAHQYNGEPELAARAQAAGARFSIVTENVGQAGTALDLHEAWMNSPHHRENLLDAQVDGVAISVVQSAGQIYAVEDFVRSVAALSPEAEEAAVLSALARAGGVQLLPSSEDARQTCRLTHGYAGDRRPSFVMRYTTGDLGLLPAELRQKMGSGRFRQAAVGACAPPGGTPFSSYAIAVLLYP